MLYVLLLQHLTEMAGYVIETFSAENEYGFLKKMIFRCYVLTFSEVKEI